MLNGKVKCSVQLYTNEEQQCCQHSFFHNMTRRQIVIDFYTFPKKKMLTCHLSNFEKKCEKCGVYRLINEESHFSTVFGEAFNLSHF